MLEGAELDDALSKLAYVSLFIFCIQKSLAVTCQSALCLCVGISLPEHKESLAELRESVAELQAQVTTERVQHSRAVATRDRLLNELMRSQAKLAQLVTVTLFSFLIYARLWWPALGSDVLL